MKTATALWILARLGMALAAVFSIVAGNAGDDGSEQTRPAPKIAANLVFFYYRDLAAAQRFYEETLGLERVLDYGFASIHRVGPTSFLGLVDEKRGMHKADEPKTVTLSFVTGEVDGWYDHLVSRGVTIRNPLRDATRHPTRGFVASDPEGYFLEFETFLEHPQNKSLREKLAGVKAVVPESKLEAAGRPGRPASLGVQATVFWLYYKDVPAAQRFYETAMGQTLFVDQGFAKVYSSSAAGFIGLVDEAQGLHHFSETKAVNVAFITPELEAWQDRLKASGAAIRDPLGPAEGGRVRAFVGLDPAGYFLEFNWFASVPENARILELMGK
jgi:predicted enzyme related to lactoylglutathione lyase